MISNISCGKGREYSQKSAFVDPARQEGHSTEISRWQSERRNLPSFFSTSFVPVCTQVVQIFPQSCSKFSNSSAVLRNPGRRKSEGVRNKFGAALAASRKIQNSFPISFFFSLCGGYLDFILVFFRVYSKFWCWNKTGVYGDIKALRIPWGVELV